ncbi:LysR family transcriptional regulator [Paraburkholderia bannensis]|uniref:LysR family transcriptional regulator n=1 Tax=Paraburkholderia bannensis TaxID=765414 RepID=UPI002AB6F30B|nr:LysR family transcriptional regulator [Paraburkholderia bannensis]
MIARKTALHANSIDWGLIRDLALYARHKSYAEAARQRGVTREAVYQNIKALEAATGLTLLDRSVRPSGLTAEGARLAAAGDMLLDVVQSVVVESGSDKNQQIRAIARQLSHLGHELRAAVGDA